MYGRCRNELICDFAEYYNIYDMKAFPVRYIAILAAGLREDSRTRTKLDESKVGMKTLLLAKIADNTSFLAWTQTKDAQKGENRPPMILESLMKKDDPEAVQGFETVEDFQAEYEKRLRKKDG